MKKMPKQSKNLKNSYLKINNKAYSIVDAIKLLKEVSYEKFDPSIEISINTNLDTTKADQQLRGSIILPHGTGKNPKVLVIADVDNQTDAKTAGAEYTGGVELLQKIKDENWFDFDFIVTTPQLMSEFPTYGKLLGPKGLMPNPKLGTVTQDVKKAVENIKKGQIEYKTNKEGVVNIIFGKKSFDNNKLIENFKFIFKVINGKKPSSLKGEYIKSIYISTTMGPGIRIEKNKIE